MSKQDMEQQIWEYIDGNCSEAERQHVQHMLATDARWKALYEQLVQLHTSLPAAIDTEQPSLRFTKNVMESIAQTTIAPATRRYINPTVIRLISGFFVLSLLALLVYSIMMADWSTSTETVTAFSFGNTAVFNALISVNVIIGLLLLDTFLRRKKTQQSLS